MNSLLKNKDDNFTEPTLLTSEEQSLFLHGTVSFSARICFSEM